MPQGDRLRIEGSTRAHAESLHGALEEFRPEFVRVDGSWQVDVRLGELAPALLRLFDSIGTWLDAEQLDSVILDFDDRDYTLLGIDPEEAFQRLRKSARDTSMNLHRLAEQVVARPQAAEDVLEDA